MGNRQPIGQWNDQEAEDTILRSLQGLRYGSVEIIVHDSRIVQIERKEKLRFDTNQARASMKSAG
ncbi:MAG TPA: YezD family protein [Nitrospiraceae bacterium]|nr:YezD family protein [Nitrospiraceae bacterium]